MSCIVLAASYWVCITVAIPCPPVVVLPPPSPLSGAPRTRDHAPVWMACVFSAGVWPAPSAKYSTTESGSRESGSGECTAKRHAVLIEHLVHGQFRCTARLPDFPTAFCARARFPAILPCYT